MISRHDSSSGVMSAPPPEVVIILLPLNDNTPYLPNVPSTCPLNLEPKPSAASSTTGISYLLAISIIRSIWYGMPYSATGTIALGFLPVLAILSLIASSSNSGSIFHVSRSESMNTGVAPRYVIGCEEAQNVKLCTSTSSPGPTPHANSARCTAAVPALSATTRFSFNSGVIMHCELCARTCSLCLQRIMNCSRSFSNPFTFGPRGTTQFVSNASLIYFCSHPSSLM